MKKSSANDVHRIANFHKNPRAEQKKGPPHHRVGRPTGDGRKELQETLPEREKRYRAEPTEEGLNMKIKVVQPQPAQTGVTMRPEKSPIVPTLGNPFIVKQVHGNIRTCFGCKGSLKNERLCVAHEQSDYYYNSAQRKWLSTQPENKHFHVSPNCIRAGNNPGFQVDMLVYED